MNQAVMVQYEGTLHPLSLLDKLAKDFIQEDYILTNHKENLDVLCSRMERLSQSKPGRRKPVYTLYSGGDCAFIVSLKETSPLMTEFAATPPEERDQKVLAKFILQPLLELDTEKQTHNLIYTKDLPAAIKTVDAGQYPYLFIFNF